MSWQDLVLPAGVRARAWSPRAPTAGVLLAQDGSAYDHEAHLGRWSARMI